MDCMEFLWLSVQFETAAPEGLSGARQALLSTFGMDTVRGYEGADLKDLPGAPPAM